MTPLPDGVVIKNFDRLPELLEADTWDLYKAAFTDLNTQALQRHLMYRGEYANVAADANVTKFVAYNPSGQITGMAVVTNSLYSWPLIAPEAFQKRWPEHYNTARIWYIGWAFTVGVQPGVYDALIRECSAPARACNGMVFTDHCARRAALAKRSLPMVRAYDPRLETFVADVQEFHAWTFPGELPPSAA